ncbi:hypothetical protein [Streptomyces zaomyceticus]|uniref:hypothetical protein n=1 Tax=Streptomyces zaomyceticus TaxID=68286 RepID=UPI0033AD54DA
MLRLSAFAVTTALSLGSTPAQAMDEPAELTVMSDEQYKGTNPDVVKKSIGGTSNPTTSRDQPHRLVRDGALVATCELLDPPRKFANIRIIVQYHWQTADNRYSLSDRNAKIGVIMACCRSVPRDRCPDKVNEA